MKAEYYKEIILNAYNDKELTQDDFKDTLEHYAKLLKEEILKKNK
jgi:hypothetical protein